MPASQVKLDRPHAALHRCVAEMPGANADDLRGSGGYTYSARDQLLAEEPDTDTIGVPDVLTATTWEMERGWREKGKGRA